MPYRFSDYNHSNNPPSGQVIIRGISEGLVLSFSTSEKNDTEPFLITISPDILDYFVRSILQEATRSKFDRIIEVNFSSYIIGVMENHPSLKNETITEDSDTYKVLKNFYVQGAISDGSVDSFLSDLIPTKGNLDTSKLTMAELLSAYNSGFHDLEEMSEDYSDEEDDEEDNLEFLG